MPLRKEPPPAAGDGSGDFSGICRGGGGSTGRCHFWLPDKRRLCANNTLPSSQFCGNHNSGARRVPCPIDPSHSVLEENLEYHVKRCPFRKQAQVLETQSYYSKGINAGVNEPEEGNVDSSEKRRAVHELTMAEFYDILNKIKSIYSAVSVVLPDSYAVPDACYKWLKQQQERQLPYQEKHAVQQASILGNMEAFGILRKPAEELMDLACGEHGESVCLNGAESEVPSVIEFGAGRGYLTHMLTDCYGIKKIFLVERRSYKFKADRSLRQNQRIVLERLRIDIEDLDLNAIESLRGHHYLAIGKHLCGPATDTNFLTDLGITKDFFHAMTWFSSWAVDAAHGSALPNIVDQRIHENMSKKDGYDLEGKGVEEAIRNMPVAERAVIGFMCKEIIDTGRLLWLREQGLDAQLVKYVPTNISPENHLLVARSMKL